MANFGVAFNPGADEPRTSGDPAGQGADRLQQAVRLLNLRLPRVNTGGVAPNALMQSRGGQPGMDSAMSLQALQRLMQMMAGLGGSPQEAGMAAPQGGMARVGIGQGLPPSFLDGPVSPGGPPNLPPPFMGGPVSPGGPRNLPPPPMSGPVSPPGPPLMPKPLPKITGPISPGGPKNLPKPKITGPVSPSGPKNLPRIRPISMI